MKKLSLDSLTVESFTTVAPEPPARGTVQGNYLDTKEICDSTRVARDCFCSRYCPSSLCTAPMQPGCIVP